MSKSVVATLAPVSSPQKGLSGAPYLKVNLAPQTPALLPMNFAQEALVVMVEQITQIPNLSPGFLGLLNQRSRIYWVVDLPQLLGLDPIPFQFHEYNIVIMRTGKTPLGLAVPKIEGVIRFPDDDVQSPIGSVAPALVPHLRGCIAEDREILMILDPETIINTATSL